MFKKKFIELCRARGVSPTNVCLEIGLSHAVFSKWTDESLPRNTTLVKLAEYFNVPVEYFTESNNIVESQIIHGNYGIIGSTHAPVTIINGSERKLSDQAVELLNIFEQLSIVDQAKLIVFAEELKNKNNTPQSEV